jgi:hypothetical protein
MQDSSIASFWKDRNRVQKGYVTIVSREEPRAITTIGPEKIS